MVDHKWAAKVVYIWEGAGQECASSGSEHYTGDWLPESRFESHYNFVFLFLLVF